MINKPKNCDNCAKCCTWEAEIYSEDEIPEEMKTFLPGVFEDGSGDMWMMKRNPETDTCIALDLKTLKCFIYKNRPTQCREFELGGKMCLLARRTSSVKISP